MDLLSSIALYFVLWWLCLFVSLPIGVKAAHEVGEQVATGHEPGAPAQPKLWMKIILATVLAAILLYLTQMAISSEWLQGYWG